MSTCAKRTQNVRKTVKNGSRIMQNVGKTVSIRCRRPRRSNLRQRAPRAAVGFQLCPRSRPASGVSADRNRQFWRNLIVLLLVTGISTCAKPAQNLRKTVRNGSRIMQNVGKTVSIRCRRGIGFRPSSATIEPTAASAARCRCLSTAGSCSPPRTADLCVHRDP